MRELIKYLNTIACILVRINREDLVTMTIGNHTAAYIKEWISRLERSFFDFWARLDDRNRKNFLDLLQTWEVGQTLEEKAAENGFAVEVYKPGEYSNIDHPVAFGQIECEFTKKGEMEKFLRWFGDFPLINVALGEEVKKSVLYMDETSLDVTPKRENFLIIGIY